MIRIATTTGEPRTVFTVLCKRLQPLSSNHNFVNSPSQSRRKQRRRKPLSASPNPVDALPSASRPGHSPEWKTVSLLEKRRKSKDLHILRWIDGCRRRAHNNRWMQHTSDLAAPSGGAFMVWFVSQTLFFCNLIVDVQRNSVLLTGRDKPAKKLLRDATCRDAPTDGKLRGTWLSV